MKNLFEREDSFVLKVGLVLLAVIAVGIYFFSVSMSNYPHDNLVEEFVEKIIEKKIGVDIDLSPDSPEQK
jgi:hypothetical protein